MEVDVTYNISIVLQIGDDLGEIYDKIQNLRDTMYTVSERVPEIVSIQELYDITPQINHKRIQIILRWFMPENENIIKVENGRLIINVPIFTIGQESKTGKSTVFFSTQGNIVINDGFVIGINLYKSNRKT